MTFNDNNVNIAGAYHHGDLRSALISKGLALLENREGAAPGLRELAREVGVSATAIYRHFPDKEALMQAFADEGLRLLAEAQERAAEACADDRAAFKASGRAYVAFALAHPALFRLVMTGGSGDEILREPGEMTRPMRLLFEMSRRSLPPGASEARIRARALSAWSVVHGLATLLLAGQVEHDDALIDAVLEDHAED